MHTNGVKMDIRLLLLFLFSFFEVSLQGMDVQGMAGGSAPTIVDTTEKEPAKNISGSIPLAIRCAVVAGKYWDPKDIEKVTPQCLSLVAIFGDEHPLAIAVRERAMAKVLPYLTCYKKDALAQTEKDEASENAAWRGDIDGLKALFALGADSRKVGKHILSRNFYHNDVVKFMVKTEPELVSKSLVATCGRGDQSENQDIIAMVKWLLVQKGVDVNTADSRFSDVTTVDSRFAPLCYAALNGRLEVCHMLVEHGAQVHGTRALGNAVQQGHCDVARYFLGLKNEQGDYVLSVGDLNAALLEVDGEGLVLAQQLFGRGADVNAHDGECLYRAVVRRDVEKVRWLLEHGARVDLGREQSSMAFPYPPCSSLALQVACGGCGHDKSGPWSNPLPLHCADSGCYEIAKLLVEHGANVHARFDEALRLARAKGDAAIETLLLQHKTKKCCSCALM